MNMEAFINPLVAVVMVKFVTQHWSITSLLNNLPGEMNNGGTKNPSAEHDAAIFI